MTLFWFLCVSMTAVALAFVLLPLWRQPPPSSGVEANALNLQVIRQQLAELEQDLATGALDETQYQSARRDLEKELLLDYAEPPRSRAEGRAKPWMAAAIGLFLPAIAFAMYHQLGNPDIISRSAGDTTVSTAMDHSQAQLPSMDQLVERLAQRLAQQPDNLDGWMMLGRSYLAMGRMQDAINAYGQAYKLAPGNVEILLAYAQSLGMAQGNRLQGQPSQLIAQAEKISPEDPNVLWLSGVTSFEQADYPSALAKWEKVLAALEPGSDDAAEVSTAIEDARSRLGLGHEKALPSLGAGTQTQATAATSPAPRPEAVIPGAISFRVRLAAELQAKVLPSDRIFIYARAHNGPRMPLAAQSRQVSDLPLQITLDDSQAMTAEFKLSSFPQVIIGARISKSGSATPQSGDLEAEIGPLVPGQGDILELVIDKIRP